MKNKIILSLLGVGLLSAGMVYGKDAVDPNQENYKSTSQIGYTRWAVAKVGVEANTPWTSSTAITNVISASAATFGKVVFIPGSVADTIKIFNAATGAAAVNSTSVFETTANSPTNGNSPVQGVGAAQIYDLLPGWDGSSGIVTILSHANTSTGVKAYISWDQTRP